MLLSFYASLLPSICQSSEVSVGRRNQSDIAFAAIGRQDVIDALQGMSCSAGFAAQQIRGFVSNEGVCKMQRAKSHPHPRVTLPDMIPKDGVRGASCIRDCQAGAGTDNIDLHDSSSQHRHWPNILGELTRLSISICHQAPISNASPECSC